MLLGVLPCRDDNKTKTTYWEVAVWVENSKGEQISETQDAKEGQNDAARRVALNKLLKVLQK